MTTPCISRRESTSRYFPVIRFKLTKLCLPEMPDSETPDRHLKLHRKLLKKQRNKAGGNGTKLSSLAKITQSLLGLKLCKVLHRICRLSPMQEVQVVPKLTHMWQANRIRMTNWEKRPLSLEHVIPSPTSPTYRMPGGRDRL